MKLRYIDALRGLAILAVVMVHTGQYGDNDLPEYFSSVIHQGARGVQLFYIASAFTLFLSFNYRRGLGKEKKPNRNFFIRRFFRIAPMYYIGIIYFLFQNGLGPRKWLGDADFITSGNILSNVFFVHGANPYWITSLVPGGWSITVEMTFYACIPFLVRKIANVNQAIRFTVISLVVSFVLKFLFEVYPLIDYESLWEAYLFFYFPNQLAVFGIGIIAYFIVSKNNVEVTSLNYLIITLIFISHLIWGWVPSHLLYGASFLILIISLAKKEYKILVNKFTIFIGQISYSAYLIHFAVLHILHRLNFVDFIPVNNSFEGVVNYLIRLVVVLFITSLVSYFTWSIIEKPFQRIGKKIISKLECRTAEKSWNE